MRIFDAAATERALPFDTLIGRLREMFRRGCEVPARHVHRVVTAQAEGTVLIMPAWTDRYLGIKTVSIYPDNGPKGLPGLHSAYLLSDATTGQLLAQIDGNAITSRRTAAASALAASYLARPDASSLLVVGAGRVGSLLPLAYRHVRRLDEVGVWCRTEEVAAAVVERLRREGIPADVATDLKAWAARADIVSCATLATEPVMHGEWLRPGSHLDLIGSFAPQMREADDECFRGARIYVDTDEAATKSGDLLGPLSRKVFARGDIRGDLRGLCLGTVAGRQDERERTVFKSVGTALEDLAAAIMVFEPADPNHG
jgi:ornithine cyclodeaminase